MLPKNSITFKEWAVVCAALESGRQTIILRKGGIEEGREGFRVKHDEFWLLPTHFHQDASQLTADAQPLWQQVRQSPPPSDKFLVNLYAVVEAVYELRDLATVQRLAEIHILSEQTVEQRFQYRHPGLFVLAVRVYRVPTPHEVTESKYIAGCKSWVELPEPIPTVGAEPVMSDGLFAKELQRIERLLSI